MKKTRLTFFAVLTACLFFNRALSQEPALQWSVPQTVADATIYGSMRPRIILVNNEPFIIWVNKDYNGLSELYTSKWNGNGFTQPLQLGTGLDIRVFNGAGPMCAASGDTVFVTYSDQPDATSHIYIQRSLDGGLTFDNKVRIDQLNNDTLWIYSSAVDIAPGGIPVVTYFYKDTSQMSHHMLITKSLDGGLTWQPAVESSTIVPGQPTDCCQPFVVVKDSIYISLYRNDYNDYKDIHCSISLNAGQSFDFFKKIEYMYYLSPACPSSGPYGIIWGDSLVSTWMTGASGPGRSYIGTMNVYDQQIGFNKLIDSVGGSTLQNFPVITGAHDTMGVVWEDNRVDPSTFDVYFKFTISGPGNLLSLYSITGGHVEGNQRTPCVAYHDSVFYFTWNDEFNQKVMFRTATISGYVGTGHQNGSVDVRLIPNPADDLCLLRFNRSAYYDIVLKDIHGRVLRQEAFTGSTFTLDKRGLGSGLYFIEITRDNAINEVKKLVFR